MRLKQTPLLALITAILSAWLSFGLYPAHAGTVPGAVRGAVMVVDAKFTGTMQRVGNVQVQAGLLPRTTGEKSSYGAYRLDVVGNDGAVLYSESFNYPPYIQVPMEQPGQVNDTPGVAELAEQEIGLVVPYFDNADHVRIIGPDKASSAPFEIDHPWDLDIPAEFLDKAASDYGTLHILILASGYSSMTPFNTMATNVKNELLSKAPFSSRTGDIEVHIHPNTASLGCAPGCNGIDRLLCCSSSAVMAAAAASGYKYDEIIVLHNTATYSGGGYRDFGSYQSNSYSSYSANYHGSYTPIMAIHEFGHSFGNLCDEYTYGSEGYSYYSCVNCRASCTGWSSITSGCNLSCDARPSYYRPEGSVMLSFNFQNYNIPSRDWSLTPRLEFFAGAASDPSDPSEYEDLDPEVTAVFPEADRTDVPIDHPISVRFNKPMDMDTVKSNFFIKKTSDGSAVSGTYQYTMFSAAFFPDADLANRTSYTATIGGSEAKDSWGNNLGNDYTWSFTTGDLYMPIPVFGPWGWIPAGLMLAAAGILCLRRRTSTNRPGISGKNRAP